MPGGKIEYSVVLELKTLRCWKQTHERQKIFTRQFLVIKRVQACTHSAEWTCEHKMADSGSSFYPWCSCICPSPGICPGQRFTVFLDWLKGLGDGLGHGIWQAIFAGNGVYKNPEEETERFKQCKSPEMVTWRILSNLRGWHILG
jgi:hypothetical protein